MNRRTANAIGSNEEKALLKLAGRVEHEIECFALAAVLPSEQVQTWIACHLLLPMGQERLADMVFSMSMGTRIGPLQLPEMAGLGSTHRSGAHSETSNSPGAIPPKGPQKTAARQAISTRQKAYWSEMTPEQRKAEWKRRRALGRRRKTQEARRKLAKSA